METSGIVSRTVAILVLLFGTFICGTIPIYLVRRLRRTVGEIENAGKLVTAGSLVTSFMMCFGGGVLFATCFVHLLPDVRESFEAASAVSVGNETLDHAHDDSHSHEFPLPEFLVCAGFLAVYFVEEVLHAALGHVHGPKEGPEVHGHSHSPAVLTCYNRDADMEVSSLQDPLRKRSFLANQLPATASTKNDVSYGSTDTANGASRDSNNGEVVLNPAQVAPRSTPLVTQSAPQWNSEHHHSHGLGKGGDKVKLSLGGLLIVVALSFHSIFEGLAIGLQQSNKDVWTTLAAVAIHKFVIAFVVGLEVYAEGTRTVVVIIYMVIFSVMSPVGILIGLVSQITLEGQTNMAIGYLNALATGTLLYVTFFEVLQREKNSQLSGLLQFLAVVLGFGIMVVINVFSG